jgi:ATP-dependent protease HslVU (ClpYQ) peptidase subunit
MTAIAAVIHEGKVWMGADSAVTEGSSLTVMATPKVFRVGPFTIGACGSARVVRVLQYGLSVPKQARGVRADEFIATTFVDAVRKALQAAGIAEKKDGRESYEADFIVAYRGRLWIVDEDYAALEIARDYEGTGSGGDVVRGALGATASLAPRARILRALKLAEEHDALVRRPFTILEPT